MLILLLMCDTIPILHIFSSRTVISLAVFVIKFILTGCGLVLDMDSNLKLLVSSGFSVYFDIRC